MNESQSPKKTLAIVVGLWILISILRILFYHEINSALWVLSLFVDAGLALAGVVLAVVLTLRKRRGPIIAAAMILALVGLGWFTPLGWKVGTYFRMWRMESTYQAEVTRILELDAGALDSLKPGPTRIDEGPPRRIAFSWGGILDNWTGIVYDPTGEVMISRQFKSGDSTASRAKQNEIRDLFGGHLQNAHHLWGNWYYCVFT